MRLRRLCGLCYADAFLRGASEWVRRAVARYEWALLHSRWSRFGHRQHPGRAGRCSARRPAPPVATARALAALAGRCARGPAALAGVGPAGGGLSPGWNARRRRRSDTS